MPRILVALAALLLAASPALAARVEGVRLLANGKDAARLEIVLDQPGAAGVAWGEAPGAWSGEASSTEPGLRHVLELTGLAPDRRWFYQASADGVAQDEVHTFVSGRSRVTRKAVILATAAVPADTPEDRALADALFAQEADALVLLGGAGALRSVHARALTDRVVAVRGEPEATSLDVADVHVDWGDGGSEAAGACWRVAASGDADVILATGPASALETQGDRLRVTLAGRDWVRLAFTDGALVASLHGATTREATLRRECPALIAPQPAATAETSADGEHGESSIDGEAASADCLVP